MALAKVTSTAPIIKVENALMKSGQFNLPKRIHKPINQTDNTIFDYVILDVTEVACQRPTHTVVSKDSTP